jgi:hypothetical protein
MRARLTSIIEAPFTLFLLVALAIYILLFPALLWTTFSEDDAHILRVAIQYDWLQPFYSPEVYTQLSATNFTPVVLTIYRFLLLLCSLNSDAFLLFMLLFMAVFTALAGYLIWQLTYSKPLSWLLMLLLFANFTLHTFLTRFYTAHYLLGGVFALLSVILVCRQRSSRAEPLLVGIFLFLAMLSKEVYLVLPLILTLISLKNNNYKNIISLIVVSVAYAVMRIYILGDRSNGNDGAVGIISALLAISGTSWLSFFLWYAKSHIFVFLALLLALIVSFKKTLALLVFALLFALPTLAAPHGFLIPELHGDRIFFALDSALAIVAVVAMRDFPQLKRFNNRMILVALLVVVYSVHLMNSLSLKEQLQQTADYNITKFMLDESHTLAGKTLFVPLAFTQGDIVNVQAMLGGESYEVTHNCALALQATEANLIAFNGSGGRIDRELLEQSCEPGFPDVQILIPPHVDDGFIKWELAFSDGYQGGVLLVDRGLAVPAPSFSVLLANPKPGERYQLFANRGNQWWFSSVMPIEVSD